MVSFMFVYSVILYYGLVGKTLLYLLLESSFQMFFIQLFSSPVFNMLRSSGLSTDVSLGEKAFRVLLFAKGVFNATVFNCEL